MKQKILHILNKIFEPKLKKIAIVSAIPILIFLTDLLTGYCTEDMCFSGIHRFSSNMNTYFLLANIEFFIIKVMLGFVAISLVYGGIKIILKKSKEKKEKNSRK